MPRAFKLFISKRTYALVERIKEESEIIFKVFEFGKHNFRGAQHRPAGILVAFGKIYAGERRTVNPAALFRRRLRG